MKDVSILISSFDAFSDCWKPYYHGLHKYWKDCPYDVFIVSNFKESGDNIVTALKIGPDKGWAKNTLKALSMIGTDFIIYTHEDFWIKKNVPTSIIEEYLKVMKKGEADYIRLYPCPEPDCDCEYDYRLGVLSEYAPYRTSLQVAIWRKKVFQKLIFEDENPWQFEINGTMRSRIFGSRFLSVKRFSDHEAQPFHYGIDYVCTAINKGKWSKEAKKYAMQEGLDIDFTNRPNETCWNDFERSGPTGEKIGRVCSLARKAILNPSKALSWLVNRRTNYIP